MAEKFDSVDDYVAAQPPQAQQILNDVRRRVRTIVPEAVEAISYQIPTFKLDGKPVIYVAAWQHHISLYPIPETDDELQRAIAPYQSGKGTLKFPLAEPIPFDVVDRVVAAALAQHARA